MTPVEVPELGEEGAACLRQRLAVLPGQSDGHVGARRELADQLELLDRQVVEAVEEDRAHSPGVGPLAERGGRGGGEGVVVVQTELVAKREVGLVERRDLELVWPRLRRTLPK